MGLRITGVVRAARTAHEQLRSGLAPEERQAFLQNLRHSVEVIREICARHGVDPTQLPAPSRRAFGDLQALSQLTADALPGPGAHEPSPGRLRIANVVASRDRVLERLTLATGENTHLQRALEEARRCVAGVDRICHAERVSASALPTKTGEAYALLRWLLMSGRAEVWMDRRDTAVRALEEGLASGLASHRLAFDVRARSLPKRVRFVSGQRIYAMRCTQDALDCKLNVGFLGADDQDLRDLAVVMLARPRVPEACRTRLDAFIESEAFGALEVELRLLHGGAPAQSRGRVRDLDPLFDRLNAAYFGGAMERPELDWHASASLRRFGFYVSSLDRVCIDTRLDHEAVPEFVTEFVLYHELLHKKHGVEHRGGRRFVHTAAFRADERLHPKRADAERWLSDLADGA